MYSSSQFLQSFCVSFRHQKFIDLFIDVLSVLLYNFAYLKIIEFIMIENTSSVSKRCAGYCVSESLNIGLLVSKLNDAGLEPQYFDDSVYTRKSMSQIRDIDVFYFSFGVIVIFGASESEEAYVIKEYKDCHLNEAKGQSSDFMYYSVSEDAEKIHIDEESNEVILNTDSTFVKFSVAYALAQSVKMNVLEASVSQLLEETQDIRNELATTGGVSRTRTEISQHIGRLFNERYLINMHSDILDTPEFFWRRPRYESLYLMIVDFQDIQVRNNILNHRLNMVHELYEILSNELKYKHSTRLEIVIIILITFEVLIGLTNHHAFGYIREFFNFIQ